MWNSLWWEKESKCPNLGATCRMFCFGTSLFKTYVELTCFVICPVLTSGYELQGIIRFKWMTAIPLWYSGMHGLHAGTPKKSNQIRFNSIHPLAPNWIFCLCLSFVSVSSQHLSKGRAVDERAVSSFPYTRWVFINDYQQENESFSAPLISRIFFCVHMKHFYQVS